MPPPCTRPVVSVGELSAPPSADQPKFMTPRQESSAWRVTGRGLRKRGRVWCYPGKGTPSAPREAPPAATRGTLVGMDEVFDLGLRVKSGRAPMVRGLHRMKEGQHKLRPEQVVAGTVNASDLTSTDLNAEGQSAKGGFSRCNNGDLSNPARVRDRVYALDSSARKDIPYPSITPCPRVCTFWRTCRLSV